MDINEAEKIIQKQAEIFEQTFDYLKTIKQSGIEPNYKDMMKGWQYRIIISPINMFIGYHVYQQILKLF